MRMSLGDTPHPQLLARVSLSDTLTAACNIHTLFPSVKLYVAATTNLLVTIRLFTSLIKQRKFEGHKNLMKCRSYVAVCGRQMFHNLPPFGCNIISSILAFDICAQWMYLFPHSEYYCISIQYVMCTTLVWALDWSIRTSTVWWKLAWTVIKHPEYILYKIY